MHTTNTHATTIMATRASSGAAMMLIEKNAITRVIENGVVAVSAVTTPFSITLRSPDMIGEPGQAELARAAARSRSVELRDAALDSGLLDMGDVYRLADDPEPLVAAHARRLLRRDASPVA